MPVAANYLRMHENVLDLSHFEYLPPTVRLGVLDTIDTDLTYRRVLDAGCNRGGFLRLLVDTAGIAEGYGYDPASGAIADARRLARDRPLTFEVADTVPNGWIDFDVAFSHEVLYLLEDLRAHAVGLFGRFEAQWVVLRSQGRSCTELDDVGVARGECR
jgi:SAM-dependent methyltransferase